MPPITIYMILPISLPPWRFNSLRRQRTDGRCNMTDASLYSKQACESWSKLASPVGVAASAGFPRHALRPRCCILVWHGL